MKRLHLHRLLATRQVSTDSPPASRHRLLEHLRTRSLISIRGPDSSAFLQGLITNDMKHLAEGIPNIYSLFLNTRGRVLYDSIIYRSPGDDVFLLEVDSAISPDLQRHLKMYKIRKKVDILPLEQSMTVWASFEAHVDPENMKSLDKPKFEGRTFPCGSLTNTSSTAVDDVMIYRDPRIPSLGMRILARENVSEEEIAEKLGLPRIYNEATKLEVLKKLGIADGDVPREDILRKLGLEGIGDDENISNREIFQTLGVNLGVRDDERLVKREILEKLGLGEGGVMSYREFRYCLGIGEGVEDLPPGKALPLEVNCDYLHGVSFHKGCYIGQELTARTHHTGVVRKRLMPLVFQEAPGRLEVDESVLGEGGKAVGKFKGVQGRFGVGLMRIAEALAASGLTVGGSAVRVGKPCWWPADSPKEKMSAN